MFGQPKLKFYPLEGRVSQTGIAHAKRDWSPVAARGSRESAENSDSHTHSGRCEPGRLALRSFEQQALNAAENNLVRRVLIGGWNAI